MSKILDKAPKVTAAFGRAAGFVLMLWSVWNARPRKRRLFSMYAIPTCFFALQWLLP
jgi:hypothetical protein